MRPTSRPVQLAAALLVTALVTSCSDTVTAVPTLRPQAAAYAVETLGTLGDGSSAAYDVSADGRAVVGFGENSDYLTRAFRHTGSGMTDLGALGDTFSFALGVSDDGGVVVGYSHLEWSTALGRPLRAFRYTEAGGMVDLGTFGGRASLATGVSADGGTVVGSAFTEQERSRAFRHTEASGLADLGTLGGAESHAYDVSADGEVVVGSSLTSGGDTHAFRWTAATGMTDLGTLGGTKSFATSASADGSVVAGGSTTSSGEQRAFVWTAAGGLQDLGTLGGEPSVAHAVSADGGVVVGDLGAATAGTRRAFVWTEAGGVQVLETLGGPVSSAQGVSADGGVVVGYSETPGGLRYATRWTLGDSVGTHYRIDFETAPANKLLYSVRLGSGVVHTGGAGPQTSTVPVVGKRRSGERILQAQAAKALWFGGSKRLTVVSPGTNAPAPQGGRLKLSFANHGPEGVTLNALSVSHLSVAGPGNGATLTLFYADGRVAKQALGTTAPGSSAAVTLNAAGVTAVDVFSPAPFALDDVTFADG